MCFPVADRAGDKPCLQQKPRGFFADVADKPHLFSYRKYRKTAMGNKKDVN
jgi:hypothetical protein